MAHFASILGNDFKDISVKDVRVIWRLDYFFFGIQPQNNVRSLLLALRETDTQGPILQSDKVPPPISMGDSHPVVQMCHLPLTERCKTCRKTRCQRALECYGTTPSSENIGFCEEILDFPDDCQGNNFQADGMCDNYPLISPGVATSTGFRNSTIQDFENHSTYNTKIL